MVGFRMLSSGSEVERVMKAHLWVRSGMHNTTRARVEAGLGSSISLGGGLVAGAPAIRGGGGAS